MKITLAGFNVDYDILKKLKKSKRDKVPLTPEVFSAAYARISRSPKTIAELRRNAKQEIEKTRRSNRKIIFEMGHHSVAEHAVFNFDIMDISRLLTEEIEKFRLCSYTEKSQRYIKLKGDFVVPREIAKSRYLERFEKVINMGVKFYHKLYKKIVKSEEKKLRRRPEKEEKKWLRLKANEDARYILSLSQKTQLGETLNARNLELLLRRFASHELEEAKEFGEKMFRLVKKIAPSIILFYRENEFDKRTYPELRKSIECLEKKKKRVVKEDVRLVDWTRDADILLLATILHSSSDLSFNNSFEIAKSMNHNKMRDFTIKTFEHMELYDAVLREFEYVHLTFALVVSASCFAQLKRHRQATITSQRYNPELGVTIPQSVYDTGMDKEFREIIEITDDLFYQMRKKLSVASQYVLTNAHRKSVLFSVNSREFYHISRLREDEHAQWEIRDKTRKMVNLAKGVMPLTLLLTGGKDRYPEIYKEIFGKYPKVIKSVLPT